MRLYPLTLPNVARNVIAHELGHAIGLSHNDDPNYLMCGRRCRAVRMLFVQAESATFP
jgi:predicted Zn-dependent protease